LFGAVWNLFGAVWNLFGAVWNLFGAVWNLFGAVWNLFGAVWNNRNEIAQSHSWQKKHVLTGGTSALLKSRDICGRHIQCRQLINQENTVMIIIVIIISLIRQITLFTWNSKTIYFQLYKRIIKIQQKAWNPQI